MRAFVSCPACAFYAAHERTLCPRHESPDRPLCRNSLCRERGILADDAKGFCGDCHDARAEDAQEAAAEAKREAGWDY